MSFAVLSRVTATYPQFGDGEPVIWMSDQLEAAKEQGRIVEFEVQHATPPLPGSDELMNIDFIVHMNLPAEGPRLDQNKYATDILNDIVGDTDVKVHSIETIS